MTLGISEKLVPFKPNLFLVIDPNIGNFESMLHIPLGMMLMGHAWHMAMGYPLPCLW